MSIGIFGRECLTHMRGGLSMYHCYMILAHRQRTGQTRVIYERVLFFLIVRSVLRLIQLLQLSDLNGHNSCKFNKRVHQDKNHTSSATNDIRTAIVVYAWYLHSAQADIVDDIHYVPHDRLRFVPEAILILFSNTHTDIYIYRERERSHLDFSSRFTFFNCNWRAV